MSARREDRLENFPSRISYKIRNKESETPPTFRRFVSRPVSSGLRFSEFFLDDFEVPDTLRSLATLRHGFTLSSDGGESENPYRPSLPSFP